MQAFVDLLQSAGIVLLAVVAIIETALAWRNYHDNDLRLLALEERRETDAEAEDAD